MYLFGGQMVPGENKYQESQEYNELRRSKEETHIKCTEIISSPNNVNLLSKIKNILKLTSTKLIVR